MRRQANKPFRVRYIAMYITPVLRADVGEGRVASVAISSRIVLWDAHWLVAPINQRAVPSVDVELLVCWCCAITVCGDGDG